MTALTPAQLSRLSQSERDEIAEALDGHERATALGTFRGFCESKHFLSLELSPLMAAIMDASEGRRPTTIDDEASVKHFGCVLAKLPRRRRRLIGVRAGGRGGKSSRLIAPKAIHAALTVPVPTLAPGERALSLLIAPDLRFAYQDLTFVKGYIEASPALSALAINETADQVELIRPDGLPVIIAVRAASRGGKGGRGFVLVNAGLDEAAFFRDEGSGLVNDREIYRAVEQRVVPGGQTWLASTPWVANTGVLEDTISREFGTHENALTVIAPTRALNPTWDPEGEIEATMRASDPENADREILAIPLAAGSKRLFDDASLKASEDENRPQVLAPVLNGLYGAAGDFAFRRNASSSAIVRRIPDPEGNVLRDEFELVWFEERNPAPGVPLKPAAVVDEFAPVIVSYGATDGFGADSHERDDVADEMARYDITVVPLPEGQRGKAEQYFFLRRLMREGRWRMPKHPRLRKQFEGIMQKPAPGGGVSITSPVSPDGAHGDIVSAVVGAAWRAQFAYEPAPPPDTDVVGAITVHTAD